MTALCPSCGHLLGEQIADPRAAPIVAHVAAGCRVTVDQLRGRRKWAWLVAARSEAVWKMRQLDPPVSYQACAQAVGLADHTSAMAAELRHVDRLAAAPRSDSP